MPQNTKNRMITLFSDAGITLNNRQQDRFWKLFTLLGSYNEQYDLSRLKRFDDIIQKHFIDSVYVTTLTDLPSPLLDIGTGPGFPGIPLKIMCPDLHIILAEPRSKRVLFMEKVIEELDLKKITIYPHLVTDKSFFTVQGVITRALESIDDTMTRINHFLPANGEIIFMKGPDADTDLSNISGKNRKYFSLTSDIPYKLPGTGHERRLIVIKKTGESFSRTYTIFHNIKETIGQPITSADNKRYKELKKINSTSGIKKEGKVLIAGKKIVGEICNPDLDPAMVIFDGYKETSTAFDPLMQTFEKRGALYILKRELYNTLDQFNTNAPILVKEIPDIPAWDFPVQQGCTLLVPFQDPVNVGSVIRSALALNVKQVVLLKEAAHPFHPKSIRTSAGSVFKADLSWGPSINDLASITGQNGLHLYALDKGGTPIRSVTFPDNFLLLPGIEGPGLPGELKKQALSIPLDNDVESLNAAISASIALYEWRTRNT